MIGLILPISHWSAIGKAPIRVCENDGKDTLFAIIRYIIGILGDDMVISRGRWCVMVALFSVSSSLFAMTAEEVYRVVSDSVFPVYGVDSQTDERTASGTGVAVTRSMVVTNCHLVRGSDRFQMKIQGKLVSTKLIYQDLRNDVCFMEVYGHALKPVTFRPSVEVEIGEEVFAVGNPHGLEKTITQGIISNKHDFYGGSLLQTDATTSFGSSGGGLFDRNAKLVGITRAGHQFKDISFAVPSEWITSVVDAAQTDQLRQGLNIVIAQQMKKNLKKLDINMETIGQFGKDKIGVFRYQRHCFVVFSGELQKTPRGLMLWYPDNAQVVYFIPYENNVENAVRLMIQNQYIDYQRGACLSENIDTNATLPSLLQSVDVVAKQFDSSPEKQFSELDEILLHYPDYTKNYEEISIRFGMLGFKKAYSILKDRCRIQVDQ